MRGFPQGHKSLEMTAAQCDAWYLRAPYKPWHQDRARALVWYPALALVRGPVFEIGCGFGQFAAMCQAFGVEYTGGIDYSGRAIEVAREMGSAMFDLADARVWVHGAYETLVALEVLEHVYEDLDVLERVPVGRTVVASVPSFHTPGHCRWFGSEVEVRQRYGQVLEVDVVVVESAGGSNRWWVFRGVRR